MNTLLLALLAALSLGLVAFALASACGNLAQRTPRLQSIRSRQDKPSSLQRS